MKLSERYLQNKKQTIQPTPSIIVVGINPNEQMEEMMEHKEEMEETKPLTVESFLSELKRFTVLAKLLHWNTKSYSQHIALYELEETLNDLIDKLIETAQTEETLKLCVCSTEICETELVHVREMLEYVRMNRYILPKSFQQSQIDLVEEILSKTIYKLNILK